MVEYPKNSRGSWSASLWSQTKVFQISFLISSFLLIIMWIVGRLVWGCISFIRFGIWVIKLLNLCLWVLILDVDICVFFSGFNCNLLMISACCTLIYEPNLLKNAFFYIFGSNMSLLKFTWKMDWFQNRLSQRRFFPWNSSFRKMTSDPKLSLSKFFLNLKNTWKSSLQKTTFR